MAQYTGTYYSPDTRSTMHVAIADGHLVLQVKPGLTVVTAPSDVDLFDIPAWRGQARFTRGKEAKAQVLYITVDRARNVKFERTAD